MTKEQGWGEGYSGDVDWADCVCYDCGEKHKELLPVEYIQDVATWRINGYIALNCTQCYLSNKAGGETSEKRAEPTTAEMARNLKNAFSPEAWRCVEEDIEKEKNKNGGN